MTKTKLPWGMKTKLARLSGYGPQMISKLTSEGEEPGEPQRRPYNLRPEFIKLWKGTGTTKELWLFGTPEEIRKGIINGANTQQT